MSSADNMKQRPSAKSMRRSYGSYGIRPVAPTPCSAQTIGSMLPQFAFDSHVPNQLPTSMLVVLAFIPSIIMCFIFALYQICCRNRPKSYKRVHLEEYTESDVEYLESDADAQVPMKR